MLLPSRKLCRVFFDLILQSHTLKQFARARIGFGPGQATDAHGSQRDVAQNTQMREQIETLKHHSEFGTDGVQIGALFQNMAIDRNRAAVMFLELIDAADQRRFSRAGRADNHKDFTFGDLKIDAVECAETAEILGDAFDIDDRGHYRPFAARRRSKTPTNRTSGSRIAM